MPQNERENPFCAKKKLDARFINRDESDFLDFFPLVVFLNTSKTGRRSALCITRRKKTKNTKRDKTHNATLSR